MDHDSAFSRIKRALEDFSTDVGKARADHAASEDLVASIEYELDQMKKLLAENALPA